MKSIRVFFFLLIFSCTSNAVSAQYKISQLIDENKVQILPPYKYDGFVMKEFAFELINKDINIEFVAFKNQKYQLLFCASTFEEEVKITIYNKNNPTEKIGEKIIGGTTKNWTLELEKSGTYSVVYEIPPSNTDVEHKACIVMLIGFTGK